MNWASRAVCYWIDCIIEWKTVNNNQKTVKSELKRNRMLKKKYPSAF